LKSNKELILRIFNNEEQAIRKWLYFGFIGGHHWGTKNYFQMIIFPLSITLFIVASVLFGFEIINNISSLRSGVDSIQEMANNGGIVSAAAVLEVIPIGLGLLALFSIIINLSWWMYDLNIIEKKYEKEKNSIIKLKNQKKLKSVFITYMLCMFFGTLGVHRFYLNKPVSGVIMFFLSMSSFLIITGLILFIWFIIDTQTIYKIVIRENKEKYLEEITN